MVSEIQPIDARLRAIEPIEGFKPQADNAQVELAAGDQSFANMLREQVDQVIGMQNEAEQLTQQFAAGQIDDINQVVLAVQKADLALNFALELRNKVIEAYQEISRMQI